jgi:plasmid stabilization system protein ParE
MRLVKAYRVVFSVQAKQDQIRIEQYLDNLETRSRRLRALANGVKSLNIDWALNPYYDRATDLRVQYIDNWYSVFYQVNEPIETVVIVAMLAQSEDINRLND